MTPLFKNDRPENAGYFITSATRKALELVKKHSGNCRAGLATYGWRYFGFSVISMSQRFVDEANKRLFDPVVCVEAEMGEIMARIIENRPTLTYVGPGKPSGCVA